MKGGDSDIKAISRDLLSGLVGSLHPASSRASLAGTYPSESALHASSPRLLSQCLSSSCSASLSQASSFRDEVAAALRAA